VRGVSGALMADDNAVSLLDMEASIEHLGRATPQGVDVLLVVVEPYYRALETASRIAPLARQLEIPRIMTIANKVRDAEDSRVIREFCKSHDLDLVIEVPFDESVRQADRRGRSLIDVAPDSSTVKAVRELAHALG
jgi:CO dehydrogenase maturation factor